MGRRFNLPSRGQRPDYYDENNCGCDTGKQANDSLQQPWNTSAVGSFDHGMRGAGVGRGLAVICGLAVGVGLTVGVGLVVGVTVTVGIALAVAVTVTVAVGVTAAVAEGVTVAVGLDVAVGDIVGVGEGDPTAERISTRPQPTTLFGGPGVPHCL
jgi:hypothetical protein